MGTIKTAIRLSPHHFLGLFAVFVMAGCGGAAADQVDVVAVSGLIYVDNALHGPGTITLTPTSAAGDKRPTVGGEIKADGSFTLTTYTTGDGAPPGAYKATVGGAAATGSTDPAAMMGAMSSATIIPMDVTIPNKGADDLELKFASSKAKKGKKNKLLGE